MRVALGCDHAGFHLKQQVAQWLQGWGYQVQDLGAMSFDPSDDYPDYTKLVGEAVASGRADRGVIVCGSGVGATIAANKINGVRAASCHDTYSAHQGVEHDDMNVLCLGDRVVGHELAKELVSAFLRAQFSNEERHVRRLKKVLAIEAASRSQAASTSPRGSGGA
jgi:ribose 5-phosphate isomerase B